MTTHPNIPPAILEQAAEWLVQISTGTATEEDRLACERWRMAHPDHALAWARAERLMNKLGDLPPLLAMPALGRNRGNDRRAAVLTLTGCLVALPAAWMAWRYAERAGWTADHHTAPGERRQIRLADGSKVILNTASSIDIVFDATQRTVVLQRGEILIQTAKDPTGSRPFRVRSAQGHVHALGTRFGVRQRERATAVFVFENAVRIEARRVPATGHPTLMAGQATCFTDDRVESAAKLGIDADAWTHGMLMVDRMRLADFAAELERYRDGVVRCNAAVADVLISGTFPVDNPDRTLAMLASTYPIAVRSRLRGYWVELEPA